MDILDVILLYRKKSKISQSDMSDAMGIRPSTYSAIELGRTELTINRLIEISNVLGPDFGAIVVVWLKNKLLEKENIPEDYQLDVFDHIFSKKKVIKGMIKIATKPD